MKYCFLPFLISGLITLNGCASGDDKLNAQLIESFPLPDTLEGVQVFENEYAIKFLEQVDSLYIIGTKRDTLFHVYDHRRNKIASFGHLGRGPDEIPSVLSFEDIIVQDKKIRPVLYQRGKRSLYSIDLLASVASNKLNIRELYRLPDKLAGSAGDIFYLNEQTVLGLYDDSIQRHLDGRRGAFYYYPERDEFETVNLYNIKIEHSDGGLSQMNINARHAAISPNREKVVYLMSHSPILELLEVGTDTPIRYILDPNPPSTDTFTQEAYYNHELTYYYGWLEVTDNYIYMLHWGQTIAEIAATQLDDARGAEKLIQVIDWEGNPHAQYLIPARYDIFTFIVDEQARQIYGVSISNDAIYTFDYQL